MQACQPQNRFLSWTIVGVLVLAWLAPTGFCFAEDELTLLDGSSRMGEIKSINQKAEVVLAKPGESIPLTELRSIERTAATTASPAPDRVIVDLIAGGRFYADDIAIAEEQCTLKGVHGAELVLPIDLIVAIQLMPKNVDLELAKALKPAQRDNDRIYVTIDGNNQAIDGLIEVLDEKKIVFQLKDQSKTVARSRVVAIAVANLGESALDESCTVEFRDGASLRSHSISLDAGQLSMRVAAAEKIVLPWDAVTRIDIKSKRLVYLSELKPAAADHVPIVTSHRPFSRDKSISGGPLRLGKQTYKKGIGVASRSRLVFELNGDYAQFCAVIGIDAATGGRGNCVFVIRGDGRELLRHQAKGTGPSHQLKVDIRKMDELELIVEYGDDLDLADHANWCEACLIRK